MPLSPQWLIQRGSAATPAVWDAPVEAWTLGIPDFDFSFQSLRNDPLRFKVPVQAADAAPFFPFNSQVQLFLGERRVFWGTLQNSPTASMVGNSEALSYPFSGVWWWLESTIFQQKWKQYDGGGPLIERWSSRLVLFQALDGTYITTGAQIREVLEYAILCGAPFQIGDILDGVLAPTREVADCSCAEVIRNALRWTPDASGWVDYSTNPLPTLHIQRRGDLAAVTLPLVSEISESLEITARHDIQVPSVTLKFNQAVMAANASWSAPVIDQYPVGANEQAPKAIVQSLDLQFTAATKLEQPVVVGPLPAVDDTAANIVAWWQRRDQRRDPFLASLNVDDIGVVPGSWGGSLTPDQTDLDGNYLPTWTLADLPHELKSGTITKWMVETFPNLKAASMDLGVQFYFKGWLTGYSAEMARSIRRAFQIDGGATHFAVDHYAQEGYPQGVTLLATNATTFVYSKVTSPPDAEAVPVGLAQSFYEALNALHFEGSFAVTEQEITRVIGLGNTLNLSGSANAAWSTMNAQVQSVSWAASSGQTTVNFGPPEHLAPQDILEFIRGLRRGQPTISASARQDGSQASASTVIGAGHTHQSDTKPTPGGPTLRPYPWYGYDATSTAGTQIAMFLGRVNRIAPTGFTPETFWTAAVSESGTAWAALTIDQSSGECTAWAPGNGVTVPDSTATTLYVPLVGYTVDSGKVTIEPIQSTNINFSRREIVVNGTLYWEFFFTFETDPIAVPTS